LELLILITVGAIAGTLAGLLGIGGGILIVPVLALVFEHQGIHGDVIMHVAIGTSLATIALTSVSSIRAHQKHQAIDWPVFRRITPGIVAGGMLGSMAASLIPGADLRLIFGLFMLLVAAQMIFGSASKPHRKLPATGGMFISGTLIGAMSSLMGVGGGSMSVPFLTWCNMAIRQAVATSAAIGFPIAVVGAAGFIVTGWGVEHRPEWSLGFVNIPTFLSIVVATSLFAPLGARVTHRIQPQKLRLFFGFFLLLLSFKIFYS